MFLSYKKSLSIVTLLGLVYQYVVSCKSTPKASAPTSVNDDGQFGVFSLLTEEALSSDLPAPSTFNVQKLETENLNSYSFDVFKSLKISDSYRDEIKETDQTHFERKEAFLFNADVNPFKFSQGSRSLLFPFEIKKNSAVFVRRVFASAEAASAAPAYSMLDLPINLENVDKMSVGDYVAIPASMSIVANADGDFLETSFAKANIFKGVLSATSFGAFSSLAQGKIIGSGDFTLHIMKIAPRQVRVRATSRSGVDFSLGGQMRLGGSVGYAFVPSAALDKMRNFRQIAKFLGATAFKNSQEKKSDEIASKLAPNQKLLLNSPEVSAEPRILSELRNLQKKVDPFLEQINSNGETFEALNQRITNKSERVLSVAGASVIKRFYTGGKALFKYRSHGFNPAATVGLGVEGSKAIGSLGDYVFNLESEEAREAFMHAVSGRVRWIGDDLTRIASVFGNPAGSKTACTDFTLADYIALEDRNSEKKRVEKIARIESKSQSSSGNITFGFLNANLSFKEGQQKKQVAVEASDGRTGLVEARAWRFQKRAFVMGRTDNELKTSGFFTSSDDSILGSYFYTWVYQKSQQSSALAYPLRHITNILGPEFFRSHSDDLWPSDFDGNSRVSFQVIINQNGLARFFDPASISNDDLWKALGRIAETYDNTFGLPYNTFGALPDTERSSAAVEACQKISKHWGAFYCKYFAEKFLPRRAQVLQNKSSEKISLFSEFYQQGFVANKIGADLMMRLVLESLYITRKNNSAEEYMLSIKAGPWQVENSYREMDYEFGSDPLLPVARNLGLDMLIGH